jgi:PAS domain S-box-containing protein
MASTANPLDAMTALMRSEAAFRTLAEIAPVGIYRCGRDGTTSYVNAAYCRLTGMASGAALGDDWRRLLHPGDRVRVDQTWQSAVAAGALFQAEYRYLLADGSIRWLLGTAAPAAAAGGEATEYVGTAVDLTEQRRLEAQLGQTQGRETLSRLTSDVAHDVNNLLMVILGYAEQIGPQAPPERLSRWKNSIMSSALRGRALTQQLLALARDQPIAPGCVDIRSAIEGLRDNLERLLGDNISLILSLAPGPCFAMTDPALLGNAITNLALNARHAMPGGGRVEIGASTVTLGAGAARPGELPPGAYIRLTIADTGTGLGRDSMYEFVEQCGGHAEIESRPGQGTTVTVFLPASPDAEPPARPQERDAPHGLAGMRALLVEDDQAVRTILAGQLEAIGCQTIECGATAAALELLAGAGLFDVLVTDLSLPGDMSGAALAKAARALRPDLKLVLVSGYPDRWLDELAVWASDAPILEKPFTQEELADALARTFRADRPLARG